VKGTAIAAWCEFTPEAIRQIEERALKRPLIALAMEAIVRYEYEAECNYSVSVGSARPQ
jgi:hypothetical protein